MIGHTNPGPLMAACLCLAMPIVMFALGWMAHRRYLLRGWKNFLPNLKGLKDNEPGKHTRF